MIVPGATQTRKSATDNQLPQQLPSRSSKGFKNNSIITSAKDDASKVDSKEAKKTVKLKAEALPEVGKEARKTMDKLHDEIVSISNSNILVKCASLLTIAIGASSLRDEFVAVRKSVHFLTFFTEFNQDEDKWKLLMTSYKSTALGSTLFQRLLEYHAEWSGKMTPGQMLTFCKKAGIDKSKGVHYLNKGDKPSMKKVIKMMEDAKPVTA